jgi:hypothetical protein
MLRRWARLGSRLHAGIAAGAFRRSASADQRTGEGFQRQSHTTIAAVPFATDVAEDEDPDKIAASCWNRNLRGAGRRGRRRTPAPRSRGVIEEQKLADAMKKFYKHWMNDQKKSTATSSRTSPTS